MRVQQSEHFESELVMGISSQSQTIISCLVYPCTPATWAQLKDSGKLFHKAEITVGERALHLWMTAAPMKAAVD